MTKGNDLIEAKTYRQIGDNEYRIANEKDIREGMYLSVKGGLTKREYFAAMAMQGLLSNPDWMHTYQGEKYLMQSSILAKAAIDSADALINALNETK